MKQTTMQVIQAARQLDWQFTTNTHQGVCRLAGEACSVTIAFSGRSSRFFDVCEIENWLVKRLEKPITAEELAVEAYEYAGMTATVTLTSPLHGPIVCKVSS